MAKGTFEIEGYKCDDCGVVITEAIQCEVCGKDVCPSCHQEIKITSTTSDGTPTEQHIFSKVEYRGNFCKDCLAAMKGNYQSLFKGVLSATP